MIFSVYLIVLTLGLASRAADKVSTPSEYLIVLDRTDPEFATLLRGIGAEPIRHQGGRWLVHMADTQISDVEGLAGVEQVVPATGIVLELAPGTADLTPRIEALGGIVVQKYENIAGLSAFVPRNSLSQVQQLPGVKRVRKQRTFTAFAH